MLKSKKNPFPGMNPWLEAYWGDIHTSLTTYARDHLQRQLPADLQARVEEYLSVIEPDEESRKLRRISPDVQIVHQPGFAPSGTAIAIEDIEADQPLRVRRRSEPQVLRRIQIVDLKGGRRVVTAIEFISLANKATAAGRKQYLAKQNQFLEAEVNLVEIDLLREGTWVLAAEKEIYPERFKTPYRICVVRSATSEDAEVYQASYRNPLPTIRIPLRTSDADVVLPLQTLVNQAYENGRYGNDLDYDSQPEPPLDKPDYEWVKQYLASISNGES